MPIELVATDMDGTLLDADGRVPAGFPNWVVSNNNIRVVIASGRQIHTLKEQFSDIAQHLIFVADNGALVMQGEKILHCEEMNQEDVLTCLRILSSVPYCTPVLCGVRSAYISASASSEARENIALYYARRGYIEHIEDSLSRDTVIKIAVFFERPNIHDYADGVPGLPAGLASVVSGQHWLDISNAGVNKGVAIRAIQNHYDISPSNCMAFGDYGNDVELLKACGESYAMENAIPEVKDVAKHIAPANTENGVLTTLSTL